MNRNKKITICFTLLLAITVAIPLSTLPNAYAANTMKTYALIGASPNPIGVGQETLIWLGISAQCSHPQPGWAGMTVTVTKPDGNTETLGPFTTDTTGSTGTNFTPTIAGNYTLKTNFPEQTMQYTAAGVPAGTIMEASTSIEYTLTVQQNPVEIYPGLPLPTEYWTRPIDAQKREWSVIAGNWLAQPPNLFAQYNDAPETAHVLWTKPLTMGGLVGGDLGELGFSTGDAYEGKWMTASSGSVIICGILYYNVFEGQGGATIEQKVAAVDLRTGEEIWTQTLGKNETLAFGQTMYWQTMNMYGTFSYLWTTVGNTWNAYDAHTGRWVYSITGVPSGTRVYGPNGELLIYTVNSANGWMTKWNSTSVVWKTQLEKTGGDPYVSASWRPQGLTFNASKGFDWNATIPNGLPGAVQVALDDRLIGTNIPFRALAPTSVVYWGLSIKTGQQGTLLFNKTWQVPSGNLTLGWGTASLEDGIFTIPAKELRAHFAFSLDTGELVWGPTESQEPLDVFDLTIPRLGFINIAYGKLYSTGMSGVVHAYDVATGDLVWTYNVNDPYNEILWSENWPILTSFISDDKIYIFQTEHSANRPMPRGAPFVCLNATSGAEIWRVDGLIRGHWWGGRPIIGDSIIATYNTIDQQIYAIGKGPSATTVTAPNIGIQLGSSMMISGTVNDVSAGAKASTARFPNGVAAVSDDSMSEWMKYVYMQFPKPTNVIGVQVTISVVDNNGNYREIGTTTSSSDGYYSLPWIPDIPGKYLVYASFEGSEAYYPSHAETAFIVDPPQATASPNPIVSMPPTEMYITAATVAIIIAIAIVGVVMVMMLRKRP